MFCLRSIVSEDYTDGCVVIMPMSRIFDVLTLTILELAAVQIRILPGYA
jgi:hypothetical protein